MTSEMDTQKFEELVERGFYGQKTRDILNSPDTKDKRIFNTAEDYINARALQFSQNSYTGNLIEARHDPIALRLQTPSKTYTEINNSTPLPRGLNVNETFKQSQQVQIGLMVEAAARYKAQGKLDEARKLTTQAEKMVQGYGTLHKRAKVATGIAAASLALAACAQPLEVRQATPTTPVIQEAVPTEEQERQMIDSFDFQGQDLKIKISSPDGVRSDLAITDIDRIVSISGFEDPVYSAVTIAQMRIDGQDASVESWAFISKDGKVAESYLVIWSPVAADSSGVTLNAIKLAVDSLNVAGVPENPEIVGNAFVPEDKNQSISITLNRPGEKNKFQFDLGQQFFQSIESILAWDAHVVEAGEETPEVTPTSASSATSQPATAEPSATAILEPTVEAISTDEPVVEKFKLNTEGVSCLTEADCNGGIINIDAIESQKFYSDTSASWLQSGINDDYFKNNFGIENVTDATATSAFIDALRDRGYVMPAGLKLPVDAYDSSNATIIELPEFLADTFLVQVYGDEIYTQKRIDNEIKNSEIWTWFSMAMSVRFTISENSSLPRMTFMLASTESPNGGRLNPISEIDPASEESLMGVNRWLEFFPHLFRNSLNARDYKNGTKALNITAYIGHNTQGGVTIDGNYSISGTPQILTFVLNN